MLRTAILLTFLCFAHIANSYYCSTTIEIMKDYWLYSNRNSYINNQTGIILLLSNDCGINEYPVPLLYFVYAL